MSSKHEKFSIGQPNEMAALGNTTIKTRDEFGLSLDPAEHADPNCRSCYGRGVIYRYYPHADEQQKRTMGSCSCSTKRYNRRKALFQAPPLAKPGT